MSYPIRHEAGFKLVGPDGTAVYLGTALVKNDIEVQSAEASATINRGEAVRFDDSTGLLPPWDASSSKTSLIAGLRVSAASDTGFIGVAVTDILPGKLGVVAGIGSILAVKCLSSPTSTTKGAHAIGSSTAGSVNFVGPNAAGSATNAPAGGTVVGRLLQAPGAGAGQTGSATYGGIVVTLN